MRKSTKRKIIAVTAFIVALLMIAGILMPVLMSNADSPSSGSYGSQYSSLSKSSKNLEQKKQDNNTQIQKNNDSQKDIQNNIDGIRKSMDSLKEQIDLLSNKIYNFGLKISKADNDIQTAEKRISVNTKLYKERVCALYETGAGSYLEILLSSKSMEEFLIKYEIISKISEHDSSLISQLNKDKATIESNKKIISSEMSKLKKAQNELKSKESKYAAQEQTSQTLISQLKDKNSALKNENAEIDKQELAEKRKIAEIIKKRQQEEEQNSKKTSSSSGSTSSSGTSSSAGTGWLWPIQNFPNEYISSGFHAIRAGHSIPHTGIDIAGSGIYGHAVCAANAGTVIISGYGSVYGNHVVIDHGGGISSLYGHFCRPAAVSVGQYVKKGQVIGYVGSTGNSTGPHLHFEIDINGNEVNPFSYVKMP